ncbi:MAG: ABC transporter substrate-binding protein [Nocardioidaceae bacterium]
MNIQRKFGPITALAMFAAMTLAACGSDASGADASRIRFVFTWPTPDYELVPLVVGQSQGFYEEAGLDVDVTFPPDTATAVKVLATGDGDIALPTTTDIVAAGETGLPVTSVANYSQSNNWGFFSKPGVPLDDIEDLKGKSVAVFADTFSKAMMSAVLKANDMAPEDLDQVTVDDSTRLMLAGKIDVATNTTNYLVPQVLAETGEEPGVLLGKDNGAPDMPIWVYAAADSYMEEHPESVEKFLAATAEATEWAMDNPDEAVTAYEEAFPQNGYTHELNVDGWKATAELLKNEDGELFTQTDEQWTDLADALVDSGALGEALPPSDYYTNEYIKQ